jgi:hypothetical protein
MKRLVLIVLAVVAFGGVACVSKNPSHAIAGRWLLVAGGANERIVLDLKEDQTYVLRHWVEFHDIRGEDKGSWMLSGGIISLSPEVRGAAQGEMFLPHHCAKLQIATHEKDLALVSVTVPRIPYSVREHAIFLKERPNQPPDPTR